MRYVYFYAVDPGAVSNMQPILEMPPDDIECFWMVEGWARAYFESKEVKYLDSNNLEKRLNAGDVLVIGSQMDMPRTASLIHTVTKKGVYTVFIFDHWANYAKHFTQMNGTRTLPCRILVMDEYVRARLVELGFDDSIVRIVGHPGIESDVKNANEIDDIEKSELRRRREIGNDVKVILLALEPLLKDYGREALCYDEYTVTKTVVNVLSNNSEAETKLFVRLHPRQIRREFCDFLKLENLSEEIQLCPDKMTEAESLAIADVVIGMHSVFLIKAVALGKPIICVQFNQKDLQSNRNINPYFEKFRITDPSKLCDVIHGKLSLEKGERITFPKGSVKRVWDEIKMLLSDGNH